LPEPVGPKKSAAIYVHVPFCRARCTYCDFNTYAGLEASIPNYVEALQAEIRTAPQVHARTLYFGGGTPSLLEPAQLVALLSTSREHLHLDPAAEITLEANPGTVDAHKLGALHQQGIRRLSLGVQTAHEDERRLLGRIHTWPEAVQAVEATRRAGFHNLSLDLIYGLPGQTLQRWQETLSRAVALNPEHISAYALTVEEGTPLAARIRRRKCPSPDEDLAADMFELAEHTLGEAGFFHYEISNWARGNRLWRAAGGQESRWWPELAHGTHSEDLSRFVCRHNLTYWRNEPYLGFGAGASSWWRGQRWTNVLHPTAYIDRALRGQPARQAAEDIPPRLEMGETMMMGLRLAEGMSEARFHSRFGVPLAEAFGQELTTLRELGLLAWDGTAARLTARGRLLGNQVFQQFLPD